VAGRLFNEKEVREILKRASSVQPGEDLADSGGISLQELQQIGSELGLSPDHIEFAARQLGTAAPQRAGFLGGRIVLDRTVEGEVSAEDWLGMVAVMQRHHKNSGASTQRGSNYDWVGSSAESGGSLALTVNVRDGRSRIRLESNEWLGICLVSVFCPIFALLFSLSLAKHSQPLIALPVCLFFGALWFGLLHFFRQTHAQSVSGLLERLVDEVQSQSTTQPLASSINTANDIATVDQHIRS
jgi:hypothetical protein